MIGVKRYRIDLNNRHCDVDLPRKSVLLRVGLANGFAFLWAVVNDQRDTAKRRLLIVPTDAAALAVESAHSMPPYVGSIDLDDGEFHVFDQGEVVGA